MNDIFLFFPFIFDSTVWIGSCTLADNNFFSRSIFNFFLCRRVGDERLQCHLQATGNKSKWCIVLLFHRPSLMDRIAFSYRLVIGADGHREKQQKDATKTITGLVVLLLFSTRKCLPWETMSARHSRRPAATRGEVGSLLVSFFSNMNMARKQKQHQSLSILNK